MADSKTIANQMKLAFDFLQKVYLETSYLIKEIEGLLYEEPEKFIIGRPAGYGISTRSSTGLEAMNVNLWLVRKLAVFFISEQLTELKGGQTITKFSDDLKVLYLRILFDDLPNLEPLIYAGVFYNFSTTSDKWPTKFENIMGHLEYQEKKAFAHPENIDYMDANISFRGKMVRNSLLEINDSETIMKKIIMPALSLYRKSTI